MFYNKPNIALRTAYFFATSAISGAAGGLVSYGISFMDGTAGWRAWRWIILIVGVPTVLTGFIVPLVLPNSPESAKFLTAQDKQNLLLLREAEIGQTKSAQELHKDDVKKGARDWKTWTFAVCVSRAQQFPVDFHQLQAHLPGIVICNSLLICINSNPH